MFKKIIHFYICLIVFCLPLYLIRFKIGWVPFDVLELMIYGLFALGLVQKIIFGYRPKIDIKDKLLFYSIFLIIFGAIISTLLSSDIQISAGILKGWFVAPLLFFIILISCLKAKEHIRDIIFALFLSSVGISLISLFYWLNNNLTYDGRLQAFFLSPNYLAMYLSPVLIMSFVLYFFLKKNIFKFLLFIAQCLLFFIIYLTYSYGAWFGLLSALFFVLILSIKQKKISQRFFLFILLLAIIFVFLQIPTQKFQGLADLSYPSLKSRLIIWHSAWEIIKDHSFIGIGPGMFQEYYLAYQPEFNPYPEWAVPQPHNLFLAFWLQTGLIGLIGFILLLIVFFQTAKNNFKNPLILIISAVMVYTLIHGLVDSVYWKNDLAVIFWLVIAVNYKASRLFC